MHLHFAMFQSEHDRTSYELLAKELDYNSKRDVLVDARCIMSETGPFEKLVLLLFDAVDLESAVGEDDVDWENYEFMAHHAREEIILY
jgi:hypothetical protein